MFIFGDTELKTSYSTFIIRVWVLISFNLQTKRAVSQLEKCKWVEAETTTISLECIENTRHFASGDPSFSDGFLKTVGHRTY